MSWYQLPVAVLTQLTYTPYFLHVVVAARLLYVAVELELTCCRVAVCHMMNSSQDGST